MCEVSKMQYPIGKQINKPSRPYPFHDNYLISSIRIFRIIYYLGSCNMYVGDYGGICGYGFGFMVV